MSEAGVAVLDRKEVARRATALIPLRGSRGEMAARSMAAGGGRSTHPVPIAALRAAPAWLLLAPRERALLARAIGAWIAARGLSESLDGGALDALADAVGPELADWALEADAAHAPAEPRRLASREEAERLGHEAMAGALECDIAARPLTALFPFPPAEELALANAALAEALAWLRTVRAGRPE